MAVQSTQQRKLIYAVLILALFTGSLVHRRMIIDPQAFALQLRETARGEVELTSSAVRLTLTGSRGLAVTALWWTALKKQEKHDWNEVELLVSSITKLQPYFITPWLFQSWNLAFNVAVECDRPLDKYYYVSRGLQLLADGERRNQGVDSDTAEARFPGHPDMRHYMGFYYQLKIGTSDEKNTMRCLLDLSCIDPLKRDPERFWVQGERGKKVNLAEFETFCQNYPRLVRRLREQLDFKSPKEVVEFLANARNLPSRFQTQSDPGASQTPLRKDPRDQFPALPFNKVDPGWPNPNSYDLSTNESIDVYLMSRTWYQYAEKPLPPPALNLLQAFDKYRPLEHRLPKQMALPLFRQYPSRAQMYIAETLEAEGWFDSDGWTIKKWFEDQGSTEVVVGKESKYHALPAWNKAFNMTEQYGIENGLYLTDAARRIAQTEADVFLKEFGIRATDKQAIVPPDQQNKGYHAWQTILWSDHYRQLTNFDAHYATCQAERSPEAILARKYYYQADRLQRFEQSPEQALAKYQEAVPLWMQVLLQHPGFAKIGTVQEDTYEQELKFLRHMQHERPGVFGAVVAGTWQLLAWPHVPWSELLARPEWASEKNKVSRIRNVRGPFSMLMYYDRPDALALKDALAEWSAGAGVATTGLTLVYPGEVPFLLTRAPLGSPSAPPGWTYLIPQEVANSVRSRMGLPTTTPQATPQAEGKAGQ